MPPVLQSTDLERIASLNMDELQRLLRHVQNLIGTERLRQMAGENTVSVRLPRETCERIRALALHHNTSRSRIVRQAVLEFMQRHRIGY